MRYWKTKLNLKQEQGSLVQSDVKATWIIEV